MNRIHFFEFHELRWFPKIWRDEFTDVLSYFIDSKKLYAPVARVLGPVIKDSENFKIIDLCSGAGLPIATVMKSFPNDIKSDIQITLTDKYPNIPAFVRLSKESGGRIKFIDKSIDATNVPEDLEGFRTFFSSFHHFTEESATAILSNVVKNNQGIGIFEFTERSLLLRLIPFSIPLQLWLLLKILLIRPFLWRRFFLTCIIPIVPLLFLGDGIISCLRSYSVMELGKLIESFPHSKYSWRIGRIKSTKPFYITYLIGFPSL